jgi:hypothetical protein
MPPVFREVPPIELVNQCLGCIGLYGIQDSSQFNKQSINITKFEEVLPFLEPYYLPCKASDYLYTTPFTHNNVLTILRQVLKIHNAVLKYSEKSTGGVKNTWYQIQASKNSLVTKNEVTIAFE